MQERFELVRKVAAEWLAFPKLVALTPIPLLILALQRWPYDYYIFLRWAVCAAAGYVAYQFFRNRPQFLALPFIGLAILFNPFVPLHLTRQIWEQWNIGAAIAFGVAYLIVPSTIRPNISEARKAEHRERLSPFLLGNAAQDIANAAVDTVRSGLSAIGKVAARWIGPAIGIAFWGLIASVVIYVWSQPAAPEPPPLTGKALAMACSPFLSIFGNRMLTLAEDGHATVRPLDSSGVTVDYFGTWKENEATQQITLNFGKSENVYELATPDNSDWCLLLSGSRDKADINRSWVSG